VHIVAPDLEIPGRIAKAWDNPIIIASVLEIFEFFGFIILVKKSNIPVIIYIIPTRVIFPVNNISM
jgi:hypothetical protein